MTISQSSSGASEPSYFSLEWLEKDAESGKISSPEEFVVRALLTCRHANVDHQVVIDTIKRIADGLNQRDFAVEGTEPDQQTQNRCDLAVFVLKVLQESGQGRGKVDGLPCSMDRVNARVQQAVQQQIGQQYDWYLFSFREQQGRLCAEASLDAIYKGGDIADVFYKIFTAPNVIRVDVKEKHIASYSRDLYDQLADFYVEQLIRDLQSGDSIKDVCHKALATASVVVSNEFNLALAEALYNKEITENVDTHAIRYQLACYCAHLSNGVSTVGENRTIFGCDASHQEAFIAWLDSLITSELHGAIGHVLSFASELSPDQLLRLVYSMAKARPLDLMQRINQLDGAPDVKFNVLKQLASRLPQCVLDKLNDIHLSSDQRQFLERYALLANTFHGSWLDDRLASLWAPIAAHLTPEVIELIDDIIPAEQRAITPLHSGRSQGKRLTQEAVIALGCQTDQSAFQAALEELGIAEKKYWKNVASAVYLLMQCEMQPSLLYLYKIALEYRNAGLALYCIGAIQNITDQAAEAVCPSSTVPRQLMWLMPLTGWYAQAQLSEQSLGAIDDIKNMLSKRSCRDLWKDQAKGATQQWLMCCQALDSNNYQPAEKISILRAVCHGIATKEHIPELKKRLTYLLFLINEHRLPKAIPECWSSDELAERFVETCLADDTYLDLDSVENLSEKYKQSLAVMRYPGAWRIYQHKLRSCSAAGLQKTFGIIIRSILEGDFREKRYTLAEQGAHGQAILAARPDVWEWWKQPVAAERVYIGDLQFRPPVQLLDFLRNCHAKGHLGVEDGPFEALIAGIKSPWTIQDTLNDLKQKEDDISIVQAALMEMYVKPPDSEELVEKLEAIVNRLDASSFKTDLLRLRDRHKDIKPVGGEVELVDTDDWQDLFLCGTEVADSCQRIDAEIINSRCLLAYLIDGKNRLLAIKDPATGAILARSVFRMLLDATNSPVLVYDDIYPYKATLEVQQTLTDFAKRRAQEMGLPLYKSGRRRYSDNEEREVLQSLGSPAPREFVDELWGATDGVYELKYAKRVDI